jgi:hypothetical protein
MACFAPGAMDPPTLADMIHSDFPRRNRSGRAINVSGET